MKEKLSKLNMFWRARLAELKSLNKSIKSSEDSDDFIISLENLTSKIISYKKDSSDEMECINWQVIIETLNNFNILIEKQKDFYKNNLSDFSVIDEIILGYNEMLSELYKITFQYELTDVFEQILDCQKIFNKLIPNDDLYDGLMLNELIKHNKKIFVEIFLKKGFDVNKQNAAGETALEISVKKLYEAKEAGENFDISLIKLLISYNAKIDPYSLQILSLYKDTNFINDNVNGVEHAHKEQESDDHYNIMGFNNEE